MISILTIHLFCECLDPKNLKKIGFMLILNSSCSVYVTIIHNSRISSEQLLKNTSMFSMMISQNVCSQSSKSDIPCFNWMFLYTL